MARKSEKASTPSKDALDVLGIDALCDMILEGKSYRAIAASTGVSLGGLNRWIAANPDRSHACACARELASQTYDEIAVELVEQANDAFELAKAKELAVHYRWRAKAVNPKRYGDKTQADVNVKMELFDAEQAAKMAALLNG